MSTDKETPGSSDKPSPHGTKKIARGHRKSHLPPQLGVALKTLVFLLALYGFLVSIECMGGAFKLFGKGFAETLLSATTNPVMGLFVGLLATSLVQSSSLTTSVLVGMVASGTMSLENAVPIVMGANMGTTITSTLVSLGHVTRNEEFGRAFSGATLHDSFNICTVIVFLPLEATTHVLENTARILAGALTGFGGGSFNSPLKAIVKPSANLLRDFAQTVTSGNVMAGVVMLVLSLVLLFVALKHMTGVMRGGVMGRIEKLTQGYLFKKPFRAMLLGLLFTSIVQSSSVTTSLIVPLVAAGVLTLDKVYPYLLGANVGTTVTALLASTVTGSQAAVTVALAHLLFNVGGILVFYPLRRLPIGLATRLGQIARRSRTGAAAYTFLGFFGIPLILFLLFR